MTRAMFTPSPKQRPFDRATNLLSASRKELRTGAQHEENMKRAAAKRQRKLEKRRP
jgi:hypothetical protein